MTAVIQFEEHDFMWLDHVATERYVNCNFFYFFLFSLLFPNIETDHCEQISGLLRSPRL